MSLESIWKTFKENIIKYIVVTLAKLSGIKGWIASKILSRLLDEYIEPVIAWLDRKGIIWKKKIEQKKDVKELEDAKTQTEIDTAIDNIP